MVFQDPNTISGTNSAEDVAMVRKTIATMTVIDDPGDPDVMMLPELGMSSSSSTEIDADTERDDESSNLRNTNGVHTRETMDDGGSGAGAAGVLQEELEFEETRTQHTRNTTAHTRAESAHTRESTHSRATMQTKETTQTKQTTQTQETYQTYHTQGDESAFTFETFASQGCETIGDASVEMKNALIYIQESVGKCFGVDISSEVQATIGEVEQTTAEIVEDRKEIWHVLLDQVEDQMIEQLGDHWLEPGEEEIKRRGRAAAKASAARRKKKGHQNATTATATTTTTTTRTSTSVGGKGSNGRSRSKSQKKRRDETRDDVVHAQKDINNKRPSRERVSRSRSKPKQRREDPTRTRSKPRQLNVGEIVDGDLLVVDDDEVEKSMLSEIEGAGSMDGVPSYDSPVGERSVLYFAA
ncbi:unnamed protein product [Cylindrotheca closterium]|uniref:Uncharacterized protein n=1 Tax=Cylindrotheca closterium TaxID=2856 RepID=A0AAD2CFL4_9STRA|nr:unnamed protein product [Cylindrotheca closterium]